MCLQAGNSRVGAEHDHVRWGGRVGRRELYLGGAQGQHYGLPVSPGEERQGVKKVAGDVIEAVYASKWFVIHVLGVIFFC